LPPCLLQHTTIIVTTTIATTTTTTTITVAAGGIIITAIVGGIDFSLKTRKAPVSLPGLPGLLKQGRIVGETDATCKLSLAIAVLAAIGVDLGENGSVTQAEGETAQPQGRKEGR
jgi:hypothetical protein